MKTINKIIAMAFVMMMILAPVVACAESMDGAIVDSKNVKVNGFNDMNGGSIEVPITDATPSSTIEVKVMSEDGKTEYAKNNFPVGTDGKVTAKLSWNFGSSGDKIVYIYVDGTVVEGGVPIHVDHSIWKDPVTYVAIIAVIILIAIAVYIKMRGMPGKKKDKKDKTFTQIEEERKATEKKSFFKKEDTAAAPAEVPKDDTTSTEKQSYTPGKGFFRKKQ